MKMSSKISSVLRKTAKLTNTIAIIPVKAGIYFCNDGTPSSVGVGTMIGFVTGLWVSVPFLVAGGTLKYVADRIG